MQSPEEDCIIQSKAQGQPQTTLHKVVLKENKILPCHPVSTSYTNLKINQRGVMGIRVPDSLQPQLSWRQMVEPTTQ